MGQDWRRIESARTAEGRKPLADRCVSTPPNKERKLTTEFVRQDLAQNSSSTAEPDRVRVIREGVASYLPDIDPEETGVAEALDALD